MIRRTCAGRLSLRPWPWVALAVVLGLAGCARQQLRLQAEDEGERERHKIETVRNVAQFDNVEGVPLAGVGLVVGLQGTGAPPPAGDYRTFLEREFPKLNPKEGNIKELLNDPECSLVLVSAQFPAGGRKGSTIDVEITLPPNSRTSSLSGGYLKKCYLYNYDIANRVAPTFAAGNANALLGHPLIEAEGPVLVSLGERDEKERTRIGSVWGGGRCRVDRPFHLVLNENKKFATTAQLIAERVNDTLQTPFSRGAGQATATVKNNEPLVELSVPPHYRLNLQRYLRVVGLIPLRGAGEGGPGRSAEALQRYRQRLEEELSDPAQTVTAALRLEALGETSRPLLREHLKSEHPLVRFCCAESLAYLGDPASGKELGRVVVEQPTLRAFALTALASLDESSSQETLVELLSAENPEVRYGAFRALRALNDREPLVRGEKMNETYWLHRVAPVGTPLIHLSGRRRPEIVVFGDDPTLRPPFALQSGPFNLTSADGDSRCTIGRFSSGQPAARKQCSLKVEDIVRTLAELGAGYPEVVALLRQAQSCESVSCAVELDALPQATSVYALKKAGETAKGDGPEISDIDEAILNARTELGETPTLFEKGDRGRVKMTQAEPRRRAAKE